LGYRKKRNQQKLVFILTVFVMKNLIFIFCCISNFAFAQVSVYDCYSNSNNSMTQASVDAGPYEIVRPCIDFTSSQSYFFNGASNKKVTSASTINIQSGFHSGSYTSGGMWMNIQSSAFDVAVMNYSDLNGVVKFDKFELGVQLPRYIQEKVDNFVNDLSVPMTEKLNPYLERNILANTESGIKVTAKFEPLFSGAPIFVDGYFTKDFAQVDLSNPLPVSPNNVYSQAEYQALGHWDEIPSIYNFRIRFAPPQLGKWTATITININDGEEIIESTPYNFNVVDVGNKGFVSVSPNKRYLWHNDRTFVPVGCNLRWPETKSWIDHDLWEKLTPSTVTNQYHEPELFRDNYAAPRVYNKFIDQLELLAESGANYYRTILIPHATEIEFEKLGDYTDRLHMAQEMDNIVNWSEWLNLKIHWNLQNHFSFDDAGTHTNWNWGWPNDPSPQKYCYRNLVGQNKLDFFTNEDAKEYYKQRLRYILA